MWEGKKNMYKVCDFLFHGQAGEDHFKAFLHITTII